MTSKGYENIDTQQTARLGRAVLGDFQPAQIAALRRLPRDQLPQQHSEAEHVHLRDHSKQ